MSRSSASAVAGLQAPYQRALEIARSYGSAVVLLSGGVDSALALRICATALGDRCVAATGVSPSLAPEERDDAHRIAAAVGVPLFEIETSELDDPVYRRNGVDRCYACRRELYGRASAFARAKGYTTVVDGTIADDLRADDRPGLRAAREHGVRSVLAEAGLDKAAVRELARALGLGVWDKPAMACLSSRVPHGSEIRVDKLEQIARAESALRRLGLRGGRVRHHGEIARVELPAAQLGELLHPALRTGLVDAIRAAGFRYVTLDLEGYRPGGRSLPRSAPAQGETGEQRQR